MLDALTGSELPTVLIVDDERLNRSMLAELLSPHYRVLLAKDGPGRSRASAAGAPGSSRRWRDRKSTRLNSSH